MEMNLAIDIGNTRAKVAVFRKNKLLWNTAVEGADLLAAIQRLLLDFPEIDKAIFSSVGKKQITALDFLKQHLPVLEFGPFTKVSFKNTYETPETLGLDRIALIAAAHKKFPQKNTLVVDAGTCITYDLLDAEGNYHGGAIAPGIQMKFNALHTFTEQLPLVRTMEGEEVLSGKSTTGSIKNGVLLGTSFEIDGFIAFYREKYGDLTVILTGGDRLLLSNNIKNSIFATSNFLLEGLNAILEYNTTQ